MCILTEPMPPCCWGSARQYPGQKVTAACMLGLSLVPGTVLPLVCVLPHSILQIPLPGDRTSRPPQPATPHEKELGGREHKPRPWDFTWPCHGVHYGDQAPAVPPNIHLVPQSSSPHLLFLPSALFKLRKCFFAVIIEYCVCSVFPFFCLETKRANMRSQQSCFLFFHLLSHPFYTFDIFFTISKNLPDFIYISLIFFSEECLLCLTPSMSF